MGPVILNAEAKFYIFLIKVSKDNKFIYCFEDFEKSFIVLDYKDF